jgi:hypothetical protein
VTLADHSTGESGGVRSRGPRAAAVSQDRGRRGQADPGDSLTDDFNRVYFDTNLLVRVGWPAPDPLFISILQIGQSLRVDPFVPEPVRIERENLWLRDLYKFHARQRAVAQGIVDPELFGVPWDRAREGYRDTERRLVETWGFNRGGTASFPAQTMADAFHDSIDTGPPFESREEQGFRDSIIYLGIVEHLRRDPGVAVLVSDDTKFPRFDEEREQAWRARFGVNLRIIHAAGSQSLDVLQRQLEDMRARQEPERQTWRAADEARARAAFEASAGELRAYIADRVEIPSNFPFRLDFPEVGSISVGQVITTASQGIEDGSTVTLTARTQVEFRAQGMTSVTPINITTPTLGYGLHSTERRLDASTLPYYMPSRPAVFLHADDFVFRSHLLTGLVIVVATATYRPDRYEGLRFRSAALLDWRLPREGT